MLPEVDIPVNALALDHQQPVVAHNAILRFLFENKTELSAY
jgi:hypothetical protein